MSNMFPSLKRSEVSEAGAALTSRNSTSGAASTLIARGVKVEGDFVSQGNVVIEGDVNGHVTAAAMLSIGAEAKLKAEISADEAIIAGQVEGTVTIKKRLELKATAKVTGDIVCETIVVEAGAVMNGKVVVGSHGTGVKSSQPAKNS